MNAFNDSGLLCGWISHHSHHRPPRYMYHQSQIQSDGYSHSRWTEEALMGVYKHQWLCHLIVDAILRTSKKRPLNSWLAKWRESGDEESGHGEAIAESESETEPGSSDSDERPLGAFMNQLLEYIAHW